LSIACSLRLERPIALDLKFESEARVIVLTGPSGTGKTTALNALAGLSRPSRLRLEVEGSVIVDTVNGFFPPAHRRRIGYVFQDQRLFPHLTVWQNLIYGRRFTPRPPEMEPIIRMLDLQALLGRFPSTLSGGEARRVAIGRALCADPRLLLLDEPFSGLDKGRRAALIPYLLRLRDETGLPMILVSHDPRDIEAIGGDQVRIAPFDEGEAAVRDEA